MQISVATDKCNIWTFEVEAPAESKVNQKIRLASEILLDSAVCAVSAAFQYSGTHQHFP